MKTILNLIIGLIFFSSVAAQTYTLNWNSSFSTPWASGATSGTAFNIGGSGIACTVNVAKSGGVFASSSGISAPTVSNSLVTVPGSSNNLLVALDYTSSSQYTDITFTFTSLVYNLSFYLSDIDRLDNTSNNYFDRVTVNGNIGVTSIQPVITKYDATTDPNFLIISGNVARVNTSANTAGNTSSDATDQRGTIKVDFHGWYLNSFTIRYDNYTGVSGNPGVQFIGIGNISFRQSFPLAVQLTSFDGENSNGRNLLKWKTSNETEMDYYAIERSENGNDFAEIGRTASHNSITAAEYNFTDKASKGSVSYRLKMVNSDGSFTFSKIVLVNVNESTQLKVYPSVFTSSLNVHMQLQSSEAINYSLVDLSGKTVYRNTFNAKKGANDFSVQLPPGLSRGQYFMVMENGSKPVGLIKQ